MHRRTFLGTSAAAGVVALAGCLGDDEDVPDPVDLSGTRFDYQGGMEIGVHGGPNGQIFYADEQPRPAAGDNTADDVDEAENLAWFHTLVFGLFPYHFDRQQQGWEAEVIYITDYSVVDWELDEEADTLVMPAPTDADTFAEATDLTYVGESDVLGGMGPALHPFSDEEEASSFADTHDGTTYEFDDINRALIESLQEEGEM